MRAGWPEFAGKCLPELLHLGLDHRPAVTLTGIVEEVVLMVVLSRVVVRNRADFGDNRFGPNLLLIERLLEVLGALPLLIAVIKYRRPVLRALIRPLAVQRSRVMRHPEDLEQFIVADDLRIENDLYHLRMASEPTAYFLVGRSFGVAVRIPTLDGDHAIELLEDRLDTPETACAKCRGLHSGGFLDICNGGQVLPLRHEIQGGRVHAVPHPGWARTVRKEVPEVGITIRASHFGADHAMAPVPVLGDVFLLPRGKETRPSRATVELGLGVKEGRATTDTGIGALVVVIPELASECPLGPLLPGDVILHGTELVAPIFFGFHDAIFC